MTGLTLSNNRSAAKTLKSWDTNMVVCCTVIRCGEPVGVAKALTRSNVSRQLEDGGQTCGHSEAPIHHCSALTGQEQKFLEHFDKVFAYTFEKFPNPDREIREWVQILRRDGKPTDKVVALPVKDPYHIMRNLIQIIELLYNMTKE